LNRGTCVRIAVVHNGETSAAPRHQSNFGNFGNGKLAGSTMILSVPRRAKAGVWAALVSAALAFPAAAQDLTYEPVNPSFGGDPFNSSHLLGLAREQKDFEEDSGFTPADPQQQFADSLERQILSRTSQEITDRIFGEDQQQSGSFTVGSQQINFQQVGDQVEITLTDSETGATTNLTIPTPTP
jgi:curli production assembly/transport component CsgF